MSGLSAIVEFWKQRHTEPLALATVVRTHGSTYRRPGARMVVSLEGESMGLVSGGCLEREVIQFARQTLISGEPRLNSLDTRRLLGCNGAIDILLECLQPEEPHFLLAAENALVTRQTLLAATIYGTSDAASLPLGSRTLNFASEPLSTTLLHDLQDSLETGRPRQVRRDFGSGIAEVLVDPIRPPVRLVVIGAGPDIVPLCLLGQSMGWQMTVLVHPSQPAPRVTNGCQVHPAGPQEVASFVVPDARTAVVVMTHNYGRDLAYLAELLPLHLPYLGLLGPRSRRDQLLGDLADSKAPWDDDQLASLHSPVGLDIGAELPEEVALSILSEIQAVFAGRPGTHLRQRQGAIHGAPA